MSGEIQSCERRKWAPISCAVLALLLPATSLSQSDEARIRQLIEWSKSPDHSLTRFLPALQLALGKAKGEFETTGEFLKRIKAAEEKPSWGVSKYTEPVAFDITDQCSLEYDADKSQFNTTMYLSRFRNLRSDEPGKYCVLPSKNTTEPVIRFEDDATEEVLDRREVEGRLREQVGG